MKPATPFRNYLSLLIGILLIAYGGYRLVSFYFGAPYNTFRIIVDIILVLLGFWDVYRFVNSYRQK